MTDPTSPTPPPTRGIGILAGVGAFAVTGIADGIVALMRSPPGSLASSLKPVVVLHCVAVLLTVGLGWGLVGELFVAAGRRVDLVRRLGLWIAAGPSRWFAPDVSAAHTLFNAAIGVSLTVGPVFPAVFVVTSRLHARTLMALAVMISVVACMVAALVVMLLVAPIAARVLRRLGRAGSPGAVLCFVVAALVGQAVRFSLINWTWLRALDWGAISVAIALLVGNLVALAAIGAWRHRLGRAVRRRSIGLVAGVAVAAFVASALTFGMRQTVASTIFHRSVITQYLARALQRTVDFDRDGYSAVFNGGDCNDLNARIHPGALDVPGNGIDENCSEHDAIVRSEEGDGDFAALPEAYLNTRPSFLLLSIDAMRPDHMGVYGYRRPTTPNIDAFAAGAARFTDAYCASPRSLRSFASIWTGRYASEVEWGSDNQFPALEASNVTLAELLAASGYTVAMFNNADYFNRTVGFFQGFSETHETTGFKDDVWPTVDNAAAWLRGRAEVTAPFMLWVHLMEPHDPYRDLTEPREFGHSLVDRYDEEIARADLAAKRILDAADALQAAHPERPIVVIVIGDHGEGHGEHGVWHHSFDLHDEALRVPLIVRGPGIAPGPRRALASLMDLHPTILNLASLAPGAPLSSLSLVPPLINASMPLVSEGWRDHLYAEVTPDGLYPSEQKALYAPPFKIIWDMQRGTWELFDIARDRRELHNLFDERPADATRMRDRLLAWIEGSQAGRSAHIVDACRLHSPPRPQHPLGVRFGDVVELIGYDLPGGSVPIGGSVRMTLYYRVLRRTSEPYWMNVTFHPRDNEPIWSHFHARHYPIQGRYPTTQWSPGELLRDEVSLYVERELRPVRLQVRFSVESDRPGSRVEPSSHALPDRTIELGDVEITAPAP